MTETKDFDWEGYLLNNHDVANVECTRRFAKEHWETDGKREGRIYKRGIDNYNKLNDFNWWNYVKSNKDLIEAGINTHELALQHYIKFGIKEQRDGNPISYNFKEKSNEFGERFKNNGKKTILLILHAWGGGTLTFINNLMESIKDYNYIIMKPLSYNRIVMEYNGKTIMANINNEHDDVVTFLQKNIDAVHINHFISYNFILMCNFIKSLNKPYMITVHDCFFISGIFTCVDFDLPYKYQSETESLFYNAKYIISPTRNLASLISIKYPLSNIVVIPHEELTYKTIPYNGFKLDSTHPYLKIGIIGHLDINKGSDIIKNCLHDINTRKLPIKFYLFGECDVNDPNLIVFGKYKSLFELDTLIKHVDPDFFWIPGIKYESYCYVLSIIQSYSKPYFLVKNATFVERCYGLSGALHYPSHFSSSQISDLFIRTLNNPPSSISQASIVHPFNILYSNYYSDLF